MQLSHLIPSGMQPPPGMPPPGLLGPPGPFSQPVGPPGMSLPWWFPDTSKPLPPGMSGAAPLKANIMARVILARLTKVRLSVSNKYKDKEESIEKRLMEEEQIKVVPAAIIPPVAAPLHIDLNNLLAKLTKIGLIDSNMNKGSVTNVKKGLTNVKFRHAATTYVMIYFSVSY